MGGIVDEDKDQKEEREEARAHRTVDRSSEARSYSPEDGGDEEAEGGQSFDYGHDPEAEEDEEADGGQSFAYGHQPESDESSDDSS